MKNLVSGLVCFQAEFCDKSWDRIIQKGKICENESGLIGRRAGRIDPVPVGEIEKTLQMGEFLLFQKLFYIGKNRSEIRAAPAENTDFPGIFHPFFHGMDDGVGLDGGVALDQVDVHLLKKVLAGRKDYQGFGEKTADGLKGTGAGGIDGDDQILDFRGVTVFERLQKEKLFRPGKTVTVGNVVKTVKICLCLLPGDGEAP